MKRPTLIERPLALRHTSVGRPIHAGVWILAFVGLTLVTSFAFDLLRRAIIFMVN
jgi:hypothetical protein